MLTERALSLSDDERKIMSGLRLIAVRSAARAASFEHRSANSTDSPERVAGAGLEETREASWVVYI